jgi:hypothetical protein
MESNANFPDRDFAWGFQIIERPDPWRVRSILLLILYWTHPVWRTAFTPLTRPVSTYFFQTMRVSHTSYHGPYSFSLAFGVRLIVSGLAFDNACYAMFLLRSPLLFVEPSLYAWPYGMRFYGSWVKVMGGYWPDCYLSNADRECQNWMTDFRYNVNEPTMYSFLPRKSWYVYHPQK